MLTTYAILTLESHQPDSVWSVRCGLRVIWQELNRICSLAKIFYEYRVSGFFVRGTGGSENDLLPAHGVRIYCRNLPICLKHSIVRMQLYVGCFCGGKLVLKKLTQVTVIFFNVPNFEHLNF